MGLQFIDLTTPGVREEARVEKTKDGSADILSVNTDSGWRVMDSPFNPLQEAVSEAQQCSMFEDKVLLLGAGSGFLAAALVERMPRQVLMITPSKGVAEINVKLLLKIDLQHIDIAIVIDFQISEKLVRRIENFFSGIPPKIIRHKREIYSFPSFFTPLGVFIESRKHPVSYRARKASPKKILFPRSRRGLVEDETVSEFKAAGIEVVETDPLHSSHVSPDHGFELLNRHKPDMVFSVNNDGSDPYGVLTLACQSAGVCWGTWFVDDPRFIVSKHEKGVSSNRLNFCWDISGVEACNVLDIGRSILLPLATNPAQFSGGTPDDSLSGRVVFVGKPYFGSEERYFAPLYKNPDALLVADTVRDKILSSRKPPDSDDVVKVIDALGIKLEAFSQETLRRLPAFCIYRANIWYRASGLRRIAALNPVVIGEGWEGLLPGSIELRKPVDYYTGLADVYCSDAVHLSFTHLQMRMFPNQRVFDIGAAGGMLLNERLGGWHQLFGDSLDEATYKNFDELFDKILFFLNNPKKRKELSMVLKEIILARHTYRHRLETVLDTVSGC